MKGKRRKTASYIALMIDHFSRGAKKLKKEGIKG